VRGEQGQASIEWLALVALLSLLLGVGATLAQATFLGRKVSREMARALCLVRQGDCRRDQDPCPVASDERRRGFTVDVVFVRLGGGQTVLVERLSDGTVRVTHAPDVDGGAEAALGAGVTVKAAGLDVTIGGELQASILARLRRGETWIVRDEAAAAELLDRLKARGGGLALPVREPDLVYGDADLRSSLGASIGDDGLIRLGRAEGSLTFDKHAGARVDRRTGHRTVYVRAAETREARVAWRGGILDRSWSSDGETETYSVEFDAAGRPLDLQILAVGVDAPADRGQRVREVTGHLDLTVPENLAAARDVLVELAREKPHFGRAAAASEALRRRFDEEGTVEARVLERTSDATELGAHGALGGKVGAGYRGEHTVTRLVGATSRGLDGQWLPRADCLATS